jgi:glyoxylase-like metal-dependent hydrolase (beta-lactamase superfamily II)
MAPASVAVPADTRAPTGRTTAYVVGDEEALLVDPPARHERLDALVADRTVAHVAVTHHHADHVGGVAHYAREHGLTVWARRGREDAFAVATGVTPDRRVADGDVLPVGDGVAVVETPGHAQEHLAFGTDDGLVTGDLVVAEGSVVVGAPDGDVRAYLTSLRRLLALAPDRLYPAHGPVVDDPRATCERLLRHRLARDRRVLAAVRGGARTLDEVLAAAYEKDVSAVRDLARATVRAHLQRLDTHGSVRWDGERATPA